MSRAERAAWRFDFCLSRAKLAKLSADDLIQQRYYGIIRADATSALEKWRRERRAFLAEAIGWASR